MPIIKKISRRKKVTITETVKLEVDGFIVKETYVNEELTSQKWSTKEGFRKSHPDAYEPKRMYFRYYPDISFLDSDDPINYDNFYENIPKEELITDWDKFKGIDHILCIYLGMDGNIYRINTSEPVPMWRRQDYIDGFASSIYNLHKVKDILEKQSWIRNIKIESIPWYNRECSGEHGLLFDYKLPTKKDFEKFRSNDIFKECELPESPEYD